MEKYNYPEAIREDVLEYIRDNYTPKKSPMSLTSAVKNGKNASTMIYG